MPARKAGSFDIPDDTPVTLSLTTATLACLDLWIAESGASSRDAAVRALATARLAALRAEKKRAALAQPPDAPLVRLGRRMKAAGEAERAVGRRSRAASAKTGPLGKTTPRR